ncbi:fructosamine kinase family protein [Pedobacter sp. P351]|uniref:fructosamine kinase family protein n=1 Tax=Pedobacter superstes TaxID=3133441 RepID=UPI0030ACCE0E
MFLSEQLSEAISIAIKEYSDNDGSLGLLSSVSGGSINKCFQIEYGKESFFLKVNSSVKFPSMFIAEAEGLKQIGLTNTIQVPKVICHGVSNDEQFLVLEWIEQGINDACAQAEMGRRLAELHMNTQLQFGLDHDNYMGSLVQSNKRSPSWSEFFIIERLVPQVEMARNRNLLSNSVLIQFEILYKNLDGLFPREIPSLLHGDLWSGNYLINYLNKPVLIDPAIFYGHREVDIAMTTLFGGFQQPFYDAYHEMFPLKEGWKERLDLWNLYPSLIHINLFGQSYVSQLMQILNRFAIK